MNDRAVTDEIRLAVEAWIEKTKSDPAVLERAQFVRDEIERDAAVRRDAIAAIFDHDAKARAAAPRSSSKGSSA